jgi:hypothetical protein
MKKFEGALFRRVSCTGRMQLCIPAATLSQAQNRQLRPKNGAELPRRSAQRYQSV